MARKKKETTPAFPEIEANRHHDTRKNIPTEELRDFVAYDETKPPKMLYPRDPSLDPQLVWKGKDEQDREPLEVDIVPIYIQEVIEPRAIIDAIHARKTTKPDNSGFLPGFYDDFDAMDFDRKVEFYQHDQKWANRMILGNSLHVMTSLAEKEGLKGKVQMIYIDPPYGINFASNWQVSTRNKRISDGKFEDVTRQPEQIQAFRDAWNLGVHSYLTYLRDRFRIAGDMLTQSGSIFVQIGAANVHLIRCILDESFGAANCCSLIAYRTSVPLTSPGIAGVTDYLLWYARSRDVYKYHALFIDRETGEKSRYTNVELPDGTRRPLTTQERDDTSRLPVGSRVYSAENLASSGYTPTCIFDFEYRGKVFRTSSGKSWKTNKIGMQGLAKADRLTDSGKTLRYVLFFDDFPGLRSQKAVILIQP